MDIKIIIQGKRINIGIIINPPLSDISKLSAIYGFHYMGSEKLNIYIYLIRRNGLLTKIKITGPIGIDI